MLLDWGLNSCMYWVMEHEYLAKGLTETALTTLWLVLTKNLLAVCSVLQETHTVKILFGWQWAIRPSITKWKKQFKKGIMIRNNNSRMVHLVWILCLSSCIHYVIWEWIFYSYRSFVASNTTIRTEIYTHWQTRNGIINHEVQLLVTPNVIVSCST